jgi:hypothetical protein
VDVLQSKQQAAASVIQSVNCTADLASTLGDGGQMMEAKPGKRCSQQDCKALAAAACDRDGRAAVKVKAHTQLLVAYGTDQVLVTGRGYMRQAVPKNTTEDFCDAQEQ